MEDTDADDRARQPDWTEVSDSDPAKDLREHGHELADDKRTPRLTG